MVSQKKFESYQKLDEYLAGNPHLLSWSGRRSLKMNSGSAWKKFYKFVSNEGMANRAGRQSGNELVVYGKLGDESGTLTSVKWVLVQRKGGGSKKLIYGKMAAIGKGFRHKVWHKVAAPVSAARQRRLDGELMDEVESEMAEMGFTPEAIETQKRLGEMSDKEFEQFARANDL